MDRDTVARIPLQIAHGCVVASIQVDLNPSVLTQFRDDLLALLHSSGAQGLVLDLSGIQIMDLEDFVALRRAISMATMMGVKSVIAGFPPGVVSSLVELDANTDGLHAALDMDDAFRVFENLRDIPELTETAYAEAKDELPTDPDEDCD
jgi:rsbT antagonist protein RsbS